MRQVSETIPSVVNGYMYMCHINPLKLTNVALKLKAQIYEKLHPYYQEQASEAELKTTV